MPAHNAANAPAPAAPAAPAQLMLVYNIRRGMAPADFAEAMNLQAAAAVLLYDGEGSADEAALARAAASLTPLIQAGGAAALIAGDSRICGRAKADGIHIEEQSAHSKEELAALREKYGDSRILGYGNPRSRHAALEAGECLPDYLFFGSPGKDTKAEPHPRNLALAGWWAEIMQPPCVIQAGADLAQLPAALATGAEFVALEAAVFAAADPLAALKQAQNLIKTGAGQ